MKLQIILMHFIFIFLNTGCIHQNKNNSKKITAEAKQEKIEKIQLTEQTRGFSESIVIIPASKATASNGKEPVNTPLSTSEWENISKLAEALDLSAISNLTSPTTGRHSDQALSATIIITSNGTTYTSASFDAGHPPKELEALYNAIQKTKKSD